MKPSWQHALLVLLAALVCSTCGDDGENGDRGIVVVPENERFSLDVLLVIDESTNMAGVQDRISDEFDLLTQHLQDGFSRSQVSFRVAVVSSDPAKDGAFQTTPQVVDCVLPEDPWLSYDPAPFWKCFDSRNEGRCFASNYATETETALKCMGTLGATSASISQPYAMIERALTRPGQQAFLQQDETSILVVLIWTASDDQSAETNDDLVSFLKGLRPRVMILAVAPDDAPKLRALTGIGSGVLTSVADLDGDWVNALVDLRDLECACGCPSTGIDDSDVSLSEPGLQLDCTAHLLDGNGDRESVLPRCTMDTPERPLASSPLPCWWSSEVITLSGGCPHIAIEQIGAPAISTELDCAKAE